LTKSNGRAPQFKFTARPLTSPRCHAARLPGLRLAVLLWLSLGAGLEARADAGPPPKPEPVVLQLKWFHQFQFAGYYAAKEKGYYAEEGLEVAIRERNPGEQIVNQIVSGQADYGVSDSTIVADYANGLPVVALAAVFQHNPLIFISKQSSGIISPYEMTGKRIMFDPGGGEAPLRALLDEAGLGPNQYTFVPHSFDNDDLIRDKVDVMSAYLSDEPFYFAQKGVKLNLINPQNYGLDFYGDLLFTSQRELTEHPGRAERFRRASLKGWQYALGHPEELAGLIATQYHSKLGLEHLLFEAKEMRKQILPDEIPLGQIESSRLRRTAAIYNHLGQARPLDETQLAKFIYGTPPRLELTEQERAWLRRHPLIRLGIDHDFAPYEWLAPNGDYVGMVADLMRLLEQRLGVKFAVVKDKSWQETLAMAKRGELDMIGAAVRTPDREQYLSFTAPYVANPAVIVNDERHGYIGNLERLADKRVAVVQAYFAQELLGREYPKINVVAAANVRHALLMVLNGQADAYVGDAAAANYAIKQAGLLNLGYSGQTPYQSQSSIAVTKANPELFAIMEKALASIPQRQRDAIASRWMGANIAQGTQTELLLESGAAVSVLFLLSAYWIQRLRREVKARQQSEARLASLYTNMSLGFALGEAIYDAAGKMADFRFLEVNPAFEQMTGVAREYWVGKRAKDLFPELEERWMEHFGQVATTRTPSHFEHYFKPTGVWYSAYAYAPAAGQFALLAQDISERKRSEEALRHSEARLTLAQSAARIGIWDWDMVRNRATFSPEYYRLFGLPNGNPHGYEDFLAMVVPEDRARVEARVKRSATEPPHVYEIEYRIRRAADGTLRWLVSKGQFFSKQGRSLRAMGVVYDITERRQIEEKLRLTARVFDTTMETVVITDADRNLIDMNMAFCMVTGYSREEVLGKNPRFLKSNRHPLAFYEAMWQAIANKGHWSGEIWNRKKNGETFPVWLTISTLLDENGAITHYVGIASDISLLKQHEKQLEHIAHYDALTGIPNRVLLADRMKQAIAQTGRKQKLLGICYLDLDGFKPINDSFGHEAGDRVLIEIAQRISAALRSGDTVARLGGDEFAVLLLELEGEEECRGTVERLLEAIGEPLSVSDKTFMVTASIGVTLYPHDDQDPDTLLRHADQAMYIAKQSGRNRHHFYDAERDRRAYELSESLAQTRQGLLDGEFELFYQPKVHMGNGELVGAEALIRWRNPKRGLLSPAEFLPCLENSELENIIGEWVIDTALAQLERWHQTGQPLEISVNIAAGHLQSEGFMGRLSGKLAEYPALHTSALQIEILETAALADIPRVAGIIETCAGLGVRFALDDFGTGYSSLAYLRRLPADTLKIDQTFVRDMLTDSGDHAIVQGIIALAKAFDRKIVAEGVETDEHCRALLELGCDIGQGYGIARPMPAGEFAEWRRRRSLGGAETR